MARLEVARGHPQLARAAAEESLQVTLEFPEPLDRRTETSGRELSDRSTAPLEQRLDAALATGWFGLSAFCHLSLAAAQPTFPAAAIAAHLERTPPAQPSAAGVRWLLVSRHAAAMGDAEESQRAAAMAFERLYGALTERLESSTGEPTADATLEQNWLVGDPYQLGSPWGLLSTDYVLLRLAAHVQEAADASAQPELAARAAAARAQLDRWLLARRRTGVQGVPHWTSRDALARVPA